MYKSTFTYSILQINNTVFNHGYKQVERKEKYIVDDQLDGSITIYQVYVKMIKKVIEEEMKEDESRTQLLHESVVSYGNC